MKLIVLTAVIFAVAPGGAVRPCEDSSSSLDDYTRFYNRHILRENFNTGSIKEWAKYLTKYGLCGREPIQTFIQEPEFDIKGICSADGRLLRGALCISSQTKAVYEVKSKVNRGSCVVTSAPFTQHYVIVRCNAVGRQCLPVHYVHYNQERPGNLPCVSGSE